MKTVINPPTVGSQGVEPLSAPAQIFSGTKILFISSSNQLHALLSPFLQGWGLDLHSYSSPSEIRSGHVKNFRFAIFAGPRDSWNPRSENRVASALDCIIECEKNHGLEPERINQRLITVSSKSLPGLVQALQWAIHSPYSASPPRPSRLPLGISLSDIHLQHLQETSATIRTAFLASLSSSLLILTTSRDREDIQRELHNLSGSLRFFHLREMSFYCLALEEGITRNGFGAHAMDIAYLQSELSNLKKIMLAMGQS
ncbi:Hpt domain-containing protein [Delftia tsuruhatensis]|uniref:Hpt domain-containing protein n=1 Tax=Delftia tsuruhatensis TaxID=180282 RepID=UPI002278FC12|nr:Hpt domain-containing protein [Delftia tsuruhatensis]